MQTPGLAHTHLSESAFCRDPWLDGVTVEFENQWGRRDPLDEGCDSSPGGINRGG